jgi:hypothetical protein
MRKLWIAILAIVSLGALAGVALAANTYEVHLAKNSPNKKGAKKKPVPTSLNFGYRVDESDPALRPFVIKEYRIAAEGLVSYPAARPKCTFEAATDPTVVDPSDLSAKCRKAIVGTGTIANEIGASNDRTQKVPCDVKLTLINISNGDSRFPKTLKPVKKRGGIAIRIDTDPPECLTSVHDGLAAPFFETKVDGVRTAELRFEVPDTLTHPGGVLDNAVVEVTSKIKKLTGKVGTKKGVPQPNSKKGKKKKVGFYSLVGRKGKKRTTRVTFIDESGAKSTATTEFPK